MAERRDKSVCRADFSDWVTNGNMIRGKRLTNAVQTVVINEV